MYRLYQNLMGIKNKIYKRYTKKRKESKHNTKVSH